MGNRKSQRNMTTQKVNSHTIEDLVDSACDESSVSEVKRMMTRMFKELKEDIHKKKPN
jgi:hypothetical protein